MQGLATIGVALNVVAVVIAMVMFPAWLVPLGAVGLPLAACGVVGVRLIRQGRMPLGAWCVVASGVGLLPVGGLAAVAAYRQLQDFRTGLHLGRDARRRSGRPRPRAWTLAAAVFAASAVASLFTALVLTNAARFESVQDLLTVLAALLVTVLTGVEAVLLWGAQRAAQRLGVLLSSCGVAAFAVAGFYLHSYTAVAVLAVPVYAAYLVWSGRERWTGIGGA